jgi:hypothetical protein
MEFITIKNDYGEYTLKKSDIYLLKKRNAYKAKRMGGPESGETIDFPDRFFVEILRLDRESSYDEIQISEEEYKELLGKLL